jgi:hypothetical protein
VFSQHPEMSKEHNANINVDDNTGTETMDTMDTMDNGYAIADVTIFGADEDEYAVDDTEVTIFGDNKAIASNDFFLDEEGNAVGIDGKTWNEYSVVDLRKICGRLGIKNYKREKKNGMEIMIANWCNNLKHLGPTTGCLKTKKEIQCPFRLMNILFSNAFADEFATIGNVASRESLDTGKAANNQGFWERVQFDFIRPNYLYDHLLFTDDDKILGNNKNIKCGLIIPHNWRKLREIWKSVNVDYKVAKSNFTTSGTHDDNFYNYCHGKLAVYYLWKLLQQRPDINGMVLAELPTECRLNTQMSFSEIEEKIDHSNEEQDVVTSSVISKPKKRRNSNSPANSMEFAAVFEKLASTTDVQSKKLKVMEEETKRKQEFIDNENSRKERTSMLAEWQQMCSMLRDLRNDVDKPNINDETKLDILIDINRITTRKNDLANLLGLK